MDIRYKMFPYPVLAYFSDDYRDSKFDVLIEPSKDGYNLKLDFLATLKNPQLQDLITAGKAKYVYHLECAQTGFREVVETQDKVVSRTLSYKRVCGKLKICPFIVAMTDIEGYTNEAFHEDYAGFSFNIEAGCVLALGKQVNADIEKEIDDLSNIPSIFSIIKNLDESQTQMIVETESQKITIQIPEKDFGYYALVDKGLVMRPVLHSMVVVPALIYALSELKYQPANERYENEGKAWYRVIRRVLSERFSIDIESQAFEAINPVELAQRLVNEPLHDALSSLLAIDNNEIGGEDA